MFIRQRTVINIIFILSFSLLIAACGSSGGGGGAEVPTSTTKSLSGLASKGPISGGTVTVWSLKEDGSKGASLGTATTAADGSYSVDIGTYTGNVLVEVTGGTYIDETDPTGLPKPNPGLKAALTGVSGNVSVTVTPLTDVAVQYAGTLTSTNIGKANYLVSTMVGVDIIRTKPADVTSTQAAATATVDEITYGLALASISQMAATKGSDVKTIIGDIKNDLSDDNTLNKTGGDLEKALEDFCNPANTNNQTSVHTMEETKLDDAIAYIQVNPVIPPPDASDLSKAKALVADLRNTALSIYNYQGVGATGILETPFKNLAEEFETKIGPELTDTVDRLVWVIESASGTDPGTDRMVTRGSYTLQVSHSADSKKWDFQVNDETGQIDSGSLTFNDGVHPGSGSLNATMKTKSGNLTVNLSFALTFSGDVLQSATLTGSMTSSVLSLDFSQDGRKIIATFAQIPVPENNDFYPTSIFFSGRVTTTTAQMDGELNIPTIVWASKDQTDWEWNGTTWQEVCTGGPRPKNATFNGSFSELKDGSATGAKFSGTITGNWTNASTYDSCTGDSSTNIPKWDASFDGKIEAPSRPTITTFLKVAQSEYRKYTLDISYTRTNPDKTVVSLSGNGTVTEKSYIDDPSETYGILAASLTNQDGIVVNITNDDSKSRDNRFAGAISTSGGTKMADLYTINNVPTVKYTDNFIESIF